MNPSEGPRPAPPSPSQAAGAPSTPAAGHAAPASTGRAADLLQRLRRWRPWPDSLFGRLVLVLATGLIVAQGLSAWINWAERDRQALRAAGLQSAQRVADIVRLLDPLAPHERERLAQVLSLPPQVVRLDRPPVDERSDERGASAGAHLAMFRAVLQGALGDERELRVFARSARGAEPRRRLGDDLRPEPRPDSRPDRIGGSTKRMGPGGPAGRPDPEDPANADTIAGEPPPPIPHMPHHLHHDDPGVDRAGGIPGETPGAAPRRRPMRLPPGTLQLVTQVRLQDGAWVTFDTHLRRDEASLPLRVAASLAVGLAAVLILSAIAVRWASRPLRTLAQAAEALGKNIHHPPLEVRGPAEVRQAALAFNTMQARLARFVADRTQVLAAMSHDLKTPLTRLRLRAELMDDDELRQRMEADLAEMQAMVTDALAALRGLDGTAISQPVDMNALLEALQADNEAMGRQVSLHGQAGTPLVGDAARLRRCIGNLVDNAVAYGQRAEIHVQDEGHHLTIAVRDAGPGIPPALLERVFDPFFRLEASRNRATGGTGLGLSIARNIARAAGGDLSLHNLGTTAPGGLEARLVLPR